jgi:hypothetical protein
VSAFFGVTGSTAMFAAAAVPIMLVVGALEAAKLVTCAWLARYWSSRLYCCAYHCTALMTLTAIGSHGLLTRAHLQHQVVEVDRDAEPIAQRVRDLDGRIAQLDAMVNAATGVAGRKPR